jgi:tRNA (cytidine32/uridine32-2'-O)-methyltransferase
LNWFYQLIFCFLGSERWIAPDSFQERPWNILSVVQDTLQKARDRRMASKRIQRGFSAHTDWIEALNNIHYVLVGTTHSGNIGAVARAMKNMGLSRLALVSAVDSGPETDAFPRASGAYDIVEKAWRSADLSEALGDMVLAAGTSGRLGGKRTFAQTPEELVPEIMEKALTGPVAIVFGRESRGLTNEEMKLCDRHMIVPTDSSFASMNVAHSAAVIGYEIFKVASRPIGFQAKKKSVAGVKVREEMFDHIEQILVTSGFLDETNPLRMMRDIRRILNSADLDDRDAKIIRGIFRKIGNMIRILKDGSNQLPRG